MLENLSSLFESLVTGDPNLSEFPAESLEDLIPSLRKIRKLSGMFYHLLNFYEETVGWIIIYSYIDY